MTLSRRKILTLIGGGTVVAATGASAGFLMTRTPHRALAPWAAAGAYDDPRLNALSFALLAPNPHNLQPWQVGLEGDDVVVVHNDPNKRLPHTDPYDRQITIGMGCFLEQMVLAAGASGYAVDLQLFPEGEAGPVALARFSQGGTPDLLAEHILNRRSCKEPFRDTPVPNAMANELELYADVYTDDATVDALKKLTWDAWMVEATTHRTMMESVDLMRYGKAEIEASPDGIDLGGPMLEALMFAGLLTREQQADPESTSFKQGVAIYQEMLSATPAYVALTSKTNSRAEQITAGRQWLRLNLKTTAMGLALHPVSQCLQEFPEMADNYQTAHDLLAEPGQTVQMLGRLGYGPEVSASPRWPLEAKLLNA